MIKYQSKNDIPNFLTCPVCFTGSKLKPVSGGFKCIKCHRFYPEKDKVTDFILYDKLDKETSRELRGNTFKLTQKNIEHYAHKDKWSAFYNHFVDQKFKYLLGYLDRLNYEAIASLGSGPGFELKKILQHKHVPLVLSSDLARSATSVVPHTLKGFNTTLCLFTSDLNHPPILPKKNMPIIIYEALHHSGMLKTVEILLKRGYEDIFFVEPCTNFLVKIMEKMGIAGRIEYSGLKPEFVDLNHLKILCDRYGYKTEIKTIWEIPEDYFRKVVKKEGIIQNVFLTITDVISNIGNIFSFGNFSIVLLKKRSK